MFLLAGNSALLVLGAWYLSARSIAVFCGSLCYCNLFAAIVTTGVFRFNTWGKLSALCVAPTNYEGMNDDDTKVTDFGYSNTYESDAALIVVLWICQMVYCCSNCFHMCYIAKKQKAELEVDYEWEYASESEYEYYDEEGEE